MRYWFILLLFVFHITLPLQANEVENVVTNEDLHPSLLVLNANNLSKTAETQNLEAITAFIEKEKKQSIDIQYLEQKITNAPKILGEYQDKIRLLKDELDSSYNPFINLANNALNSQQTTIYQDLQDIQSKLNEVNSSLANYRTALEQTRKQITENNTKIEKLNHLKFTENTTTTLINKYNAELKFLDTNNRYNLLLGQNIDLLISIDEARKTELSLKQQLLQKQLFSVQEALNANRLREFEAQAKQAEQLKADNKIENPIIHEELSTNSDLSQYLVQQTQKSNQLSQENLRAKNVLDALTQTKRNIEEQISALQGTLVLSKVIYQQKQNLPTDSVIKGLAKEIANLRVDLFELTQQRDELYNIANAIDRLQQQHKVLFDDNERETLGSILKERERILIELVKTLNAQLNQANQIEATQRQIIEISDTLQRQLQQQSFWVQSNNPIDLSWFEQFPKLALAQASILTQYVSLENINQNLPSKLFLVFGLLLINLVIAWKKSAIKQRLATIASQVNTLRNDSHWHTPEAMFWTVILVSPKVLLFIFSSTIVLSLFFYDPLVGMEWTLTMSGYWLFFATVLALLRPNGLGHRHFGMPQVSNEVFRRIIRQSVWIVVLLLVSSLFSRIDSIGFTHDVIGQVVTLVALALCLLVVRPLLDRGIREYENAIWEDGTKHTAGLFKLLRLVLFIVPITLIILIILGYYYTAVYLIEHILKSYLVALIWVFGRHFAYRSLTISSRRMAYRRLQIQREKIREQLLEQGKVDGNKEEVRENQIKISTVNQQIFRMADLIAWVLLFISLYAIWSDLISVAYYLNGFVLWEHVETTAKGTEIESVTLLNVLRSMLYITITYALVKNIAGILEVTLFSRITLSKGTPHTITAILTYLIVTFGCLFAFTSLGISWNKLQWVFTALSVGLGFGVREIFGSFVSGTILLFERPIRIGDKVTVGNFTGVISKIRLRSTTLIDDEHKEVVLPNQAFVTDRFINWTLNNTITRLQIVMKISTESDLNLVRQLLMQAVEEAPKVLTDPSPSLNLVAFGEGGIEHELNVFVAELDDRSEMRNFLYHRIDELFKQHQIKIAFRQVDVHLHNTEPNLPLV